MERSGLSQCDPWPSGRRGSGQCRRTGGAPGRGGGGTRLRAHLGPCGGRSLGGGVADVGARWGQVAAAVAGGVAGERAHVQDKVPCG
jgi:hypothetical protein